MTYTLTPEQLSAFDSDGYLVLRKWIPEDLIDRLRRASRALIEHELQRARTDGVSDDVAVTTAGHAGGMPFIARANNLFREHRDPVFLELLGSPGVIDLATTLAGEDCVTTYESLLVKTTGDAHAIGWHRDMVHDRRGRICTLGVYLDESRRGAGALRIVPRSQTSTGDLCALEDALSAGAVQAVEIEMEPGDVLVHDVMAVHASAPVAGQGLRRTVYFEVRPRAQAHANPGFEEEWIELRRRLMDLACRRWQHRRADAEDDRDRWSEEEKEVIGRMYAIEARIESGHYCFQFPDGHRREIP
jgi:ectoine hydroxylase-related dioxygenase (phytanoyl-CoA dioxygenase family)